MEQASKPSIYKL